MTLEPVFQARPVGTYSLAGAQVKTSAVLKYRLSCRCGWSVVGTIEGDHLVVDTEEEPG